MILLAPRMLKDIVDAAENAYPEEACGLLVGRTDPGGNIRVLAVHGSPNLAQDRRRAFEVDPQLRIRLHERSRRGAGSLVGLYHSHPDQSAQPSQTDLERAWEPDLIWLITSVLDGQAVLTTAHRLVDDGTRFAPISLRTNDWDGYPERASQVARGAG